MKGRQGPQGKGAPGGAYPPGMTPDAAAAPMLCAVCICLMLPMPPSPHLTCVLLQAWTRAWSGRGGGAAKAARGSAHSLGEQGNLKRCVEG